MQRCDGCEDEKKTLIKTATRVPDVFVYYCEGCSLLARIVLKQYDEIIERFHHRTGYANAG